MPASHQPPALTDAAAEPADDSGQSTLPRTPPASPFRLDALVNWLVLHRLEVFLAILPWILFVVNPNWPFQGLGHMDPWYYFGYFSHFPQYQRITPQYQGERLAWIIPGFVLAHLFGHAYGALLLHMLAYSVSVFSIYYIVKRLRDDRTAFATACLLGCHPFFIGANGWDYVDGGSIAYLLLTFAFLTKAWASERPGAYLALAGAAWTSLIVTYFFWLVFTPICLCYYLCLPRDNRAAREGPKDYAWRAWSSGLPFAGGMAVIVFAFSLCHTLIFGSREFFLSVSLQTAVSIAKMSSNPWLGPDTRLAHWFPLASWIVFPVLTLLVCIGLTPRWLTRKGPPDGAARGMIITYYYCFGIMVIMTIRPTLLMASDLYVSILIPLLFLVFALTLFEAPKLLSDRVFYFVLLVSCGICVLPLTKPFRYGILLIYGLLLPYAFGTLGVLARLVWPRRTVTWIMLLFCLSMASFGLTPAYPGSAWRANYNGLAAWTRISEAIDVIRSRVPKWQAPFFWIDDFTDPLTSEYRAIMCAVHLGNSMWHYPTVDDKVSYPAGSSIVLITAKRDVFAGANKAMTYAGMPLSLSSQDFISVDGVSYWITIVTVQPLNTTPNP